MERSPAVGGGVWEHPSVIFSGYFTTWLSGAVLEHGCSKLGLAPFRKVLAQIQDEVSTEIVSKHLEPFREIRENHFMSVESNNKNFWLVFLYVFVHFIFFQPFFCVRFYKRNGPSLMGN